VSCCWELTEPSATCSDELYVRSWLNVVELCVSVFTITIAEYFDGSPLFSTRFIWTPDIVAVFVIRFVWLVSCCWELTEPSATCSDELYVRSWLNVVELCACVLTINVAEYFDVPPSFSNKLTWILDADSIFVVRFVWLVSCCWEVTDPFVTCRDELYAKSLLNVVELCVCVFTVTIAEYFDGFPPSSTRFTWTSDVYTAEVVRFVWLVSCCWELTEPFVTCRDVLYAKFLLKVVELCVCVFIVTIATTGAKSSIGGDGGGCGTGELGSGLGTERFDALSS
jgi:hypothetical protein